MSRSADKAIKNLKKNKKKSYDEYHTYFNELTSIFLFSTNTIWLDASAYPEMSKKKSFKKGSTTFITGSSFDNL